MSAKLLLRTAAERMLARWRRVSGRDAVAETLDDLVGTATRTPRTVYILTSPTVHGPVRRWIARFPTNTVHVVSEAEAPDWDLARFGAQLHRAETLSHRGWRMKLHGSADVIVDLLPHDAASQVEHWRHLFLHLQPRGVYVVDSAALGHSTFTPAWAEAVAVILNLDEDGRPAPGGSKALRAAVAGIELTRDAVVIHKRLEHLVQLRHDETERVLAGREPGLHVTELVRLPGGVLTSTATTTSHEAGVEIASLDPSLPYPPLALRHYRGEVTLAPQSLVFAGQTILPDSFRHHLSHTPTNPRVRRVSATFGRLDADEHARRHLPGSYYHLDSPYSGHLGHLVTDVVSRLWGWDAAKSAVPELKAFFHVSGEGGSDPELEQRVLTAYGIDPNDIVWTTSAVSVDSLVTAAPMWHNQTPHYVHPRITETWARLTSSLADPDAPTYERIFVSSHGDAGKRVCRNAHDVEDWFDSRGFRIVRPEDLDLGEQAAVFAAARAIAGFGGQALTNLLFAESATNLVVLNHEGYTTRNEHLFAMAHGINEHYFWSAPDVAHPPGAWRAEAFSSDWEFDFARNGDELAAVVAQLP